MKTSKIALLGAAILAMTFTFGSDASAETVGEWRKNAVKKIYKSMTYPRSALNREIEGRAKVRVIIGADGQIASHEIVESTGEKVLDREIPKILKRALPFPALPGTETGTSFIIPMSWILN